eukprot:NODE_701_length_5037_cov_0.452318.p1 type:complete len:362 gc:universal NODE_701_length_5037_cov_0.452318:2795-3880(+)
MVVNKNINSAPIAYFNSFQHKTGDMFWADRTIALEDLDYCKDDLQKLNDINNFIFYGPRGSGRYTRVKALLMKWLGEQVQHVKLESKNIKIGAKSIDINLLSSNVHTELHPSELGNNDRLVMQYIVKEMASTKSITEHPKVIVILDADLLTQQAQHALRRTIEVYSRNLRFIFIVENIGKIISPLVSRCASLRIPAPNEKIIKSICSRFCKEENVEIHPNLISELISRNNRNLKSILLELETASIKYNGNVKEVFSVAPDYVLFIAKITNLMVKEQSASQLLEIRPMLYELIAKCVPNDTIIMEIAEQLSAKTDDECRKGVWIEASIADERCIVGSKPIMHLEAFVAKCLVHLRNSMAMVE